MLLRSLREQVSTPRDLSASVLFVAETDASRRAYDSVRELFPEVGLHPQDPHQPIKAQIQALVESDRREFFTFLLDDMVAIRPFGSDDRAFNVLRRRQDVASLSLRLHPGVTYSQPLNLETPPPMLDADLSWDWRFPKTRAERLLAKLTGWRHAKGDWAGSMFLDGYVFRHAQFIKYFAALPEISFVTQLESLMLAQPLVGNRVVCYPKARVVNLALNRVDPHSVYPHAGGSAEELNERFLSGGRLAYYHLKDLVSPCCHIVAEPRWLER